MVKVGSSEILALFGGQKAIQNEFKTALLNAKPNATLPF